MTVPAVANHIENIEAVQIRPTAVALLNLGKKPKKISRLLLAARMAITQQNGENRDRQCRRLYTAVPGKEAGKAPE